MKIVFTADIHWVTPWKTQSMQEVERQWIQAQADLLVVVGDLAEGSQARETCKSLRKIAGDKPVAIILGNHDYWIRSKAARKYKEIEEVEQKHWGPATQEYGIHFLENENYEISEDQCLVGCYGHYDLGYANPELLIDGAPVSQEEYLKGASNKKEVFWGQWNDALYLRCARGLHQEAERQKELLSERIKNSGNKKILLAVHTVPFQELFMAAENELYGDQFFMAYAGSKRLGEFIRSQSDRFELLVCGHNGERVGPIQIAGITGINVGSRYGKPNSFVYETTKKRNMT